MGPNYCSICEAWPASFTPDEPQILVCHPCYAKKICDENPVPLPKNEETLRELADLGYEPAKKVMDEK
jgi:hypothetical protein